MAAFNPWTLNQVNNTGVAPEGGSLFNNAAATNVDLWQGGKSYVSRIVVVHAYGGTSGTVASTSGFFRGLVKNDYICIAAGGTVQLGDTITVAGVTWTVIKKMSTDGTFGQNLCWITRPL
jgi:hypothetical protein